MIFLTATEAEELVTESMVTMLWQAGELTDKEGEVLPTTWEDAYEVEDAVSDAFERVEETMMNFLNDNTEDVQEYLITRTLGQLAHDYWLTRNHHGAGFWDRGLGGLGDRLTKAAQLDGEYYLFDNITGLDDDGNVVACWDWE